MTSEEAAKPLAMLEVCLKFHPLPWAVAEGPRSELGPSYWASVEVRDARGARVVDISGPDPAGVKAMLGATICEWANRNQSR